AARAGHERPQVVPQHSESAHDARAPAQCIRAGRGRGGAGDRPEPRAHERGLRPMKDARLVIKRALITEKGTALRELRNQYVFEVATDANRIDIKRAVETIFSVKVRGVRTMQMRGKEKRQGRYSGRRSD